MTWPKWKRFSSLTMTLLAASLALDSWFKFISNSFNVPSPLSTIYLRVWTLDGFVPPVSRLASIKRPREGHWLIRHRLVAPPPPPSLLPAFILQVHHADPIKAHSSRDISNKSFSDCSPQKLVDCPESPCGFCRLKNFQCIFLLFISQYLLTDLIEPFHSQIYFHLVFPGTTWFDLSRFDKPRFFEFLIKNLKLEYQNLRYLTQYGCHVAVKYR